MGKKKKNELTGRPSEMDRMMARIRKEIDRDYEADKHNRESALKALEFINGGMWEPGDKELRTQAGRPSLEIDRISPAIDQAVGDERQNCPAIKIRPGDNAANTTTAQVMAGKIRKIESHSQAKLAYTKASEHQKQCGFGYIRVVTEYESDDITSLTPALINQVIRIEPIYNQLAVLFDASAVKMNKEDANHLFVFSKISKETYKVLHGGDPTNIESSNEGVFPWRTDEEVVIGEWFEKEFEKKTIYQLEDGRVVDELEEGDKVAKSQDGKELKREVNSYKIYRTKIDGAKVLEEKQLWPSKFWPIIPVYGKEIDINGKTYRRGIVEKAKDSNRLYNYYTSAAAEQFALQGQAPYIATPEMIAGHEMMWAESNRKNYKYLLVNAVDPAHPENIQWPQRQMPPQMSNAISNGLLQAADDIRTTTGRHLASLGAQSNETSGVAITARQKEGDVGDYAYTDNMANAIKQTGRVIVDLFPSIYDNNRKVTILEIDGTSKEVEINKPGSPAEDDPADISPRGLINDFGVGRYDVEVDVGPSYTTQRQETSQSMLGLIQAAPMVAPVISDVLVRNMDWPGAEEISYRLKAFMLQNGMGSLLTQDEKMELQKRFPPDEAQNQGPSPQELALMEKMKMDLETQSLKTQQEALKVEKAALEIEKMKTEMGVMLGNFQVDLINKIEQRLTTLAGGNQAPNQGGNGGPASPEKPGKGPMMGNMGDMAGMAEGVPPEVMGQPGDGGVSGQMRIPGRAEGGPVAGGNPYLVGEKGPELVVPADDINRITDILNKNANLNFIQRIMKPDTSPTLELGPNEYGTHLMSYATGDKGAIVYPNIVQMPDGRLKKLEGREAIDYAVKNKEFIRFDNPEEAKWFGENYKRVWGGGFNPQPRANGGPVQSGQPYVVGEEGPEVIVPQDDGMVIPAAALMPGGKGVAPAPLITELPPPEIEVTPEVEDHFRKMYDAELKDLAPTDPRVMEFKRMYQVIQPKNM